MPEGQIQYMVNCPRRIRFRPARGITTVFFLLISAFLGLITPIVLGAGAEQTIISTGIRTVDPDEPIGRPTYRIIPAIKLNRSVSVAPARVDLTPARPGHVYEVVFTIRNKRAYATTFFLEPLGVAAPDDPTKVAEFLNDDDPRMPSTAKSWLRPSVKRITLRSKQEAKVPVRIVVPANASAGGNFAALSIYTAAGSKGTGAAALGLSTKVAVLMLATVPGNVHYGFKLSGPRGKSLIIGHPKYQIHGSVTNTGNTHERIIGQVRVRSLFGQTVARFPIRSRLVLPNGKVPLEATWKGTPWLGVYTIDVSLNPDHSKTPHIVRSLRVVALPPVWLLVAFGLGLFVLTVLHFRHRRQLHNVADHEEDSLED